MLECNLIKPELCEVAKKIKLLDKSCYNLSCKVDWRWVHVDRNNYCGTFSKGVSKCL